ncbi:hypothetical protein CPB85DRAFT_1485063 [Mucidula mucida]|nr:hypothetical protein CPB85DRAFT_1485063 [Mucidula mucida]
MYLAFSCFLGLAKRGLVWIAIMYAHNFLGFATFGPTKDMCVGFGALSQLMAAWTIGGASPEMGWKWTKTILIMCAIPLQDLRDVPRDLKAGCWTTPMILGHQSATVRFYITAGIFVAQYRFITECILEQRDNAVGWVTSVVIAFMGLTVIVHLFADRSLHGDQISYRLYTVVFLAQIAAACVALKAH